MADTILDTILLLALPASGKSEVRKYLENLSPEKRGRDFHMGPNVQLDDFPYVHLMRRVDDELSALGRERIYFVSGDKPFQTPKDWGTLIALLNEDYEDVVNKRVPAPASAARHLFDRLDRASEAAGAPARIAAHSEETVAKLAEKLEKECRDQLFERAKAQTDTLRGKTLVIEFARGGPHGSPMPLPDYYGYRHSLSMLSKDILEKAVILYVWVTPEESRRKNEARTDPNDPGSILHHGVPLEVMMNDYGLDDMEWLEANAEKEGTVTVKAHGTTFHVPAARFDNRVDKTSFLREDKDAWDPADVAAVHEGLKGALDKLAGVVYR